MKSENASIAWIAALSGPKQWTSDDAKRVLAAWKNSGESMACIESRRRGGGRISSRGPISAAIERRSRTP